ncbi:PfkB family carbohydrate kinase [Jannaschia aquimarina]|uniref:RbsK_3 protein n=1 Tax=Jannaschia aquimarina TaxID=935700 RepID=A0A0D1EGH1_9RHOB|nr:PfkB family carbohydrate kinase [Jannaschia aquimarina]KIT14945.1 Ribokinase [Jannaschia aquimarina]SNS60078.1 ribokinase [Jannaschia aquimarina]
MSVLVLGALHWDTVVRAPRLPELDETLNGRDVVYRFGGKGGNQALAAARAGAETAIWGRVGDDAAGNAMLAELDRAGVDRAGIRRIPGASGMSVAISVDGGEYGAVVVTGANAANDGEGEVPSDTRIILLQNEVPETANLTLARRKGEATVILNAAPSRPVDPALASLVDIWVVNRVEAAGLGKVAGSVIETRGAEGCLLWREGSRMAFPVAPLAGEGHGAGDVFCGTLAARMDAGDSLESAIEAAQRSAGRHVSRSG